MSDPAASEVWAELLFEEQPPAPPRRLLGELLVERGLIGDAELTQALSLQEQRGGRIGEILVAEGWLTLAQLTAAVSEQCGIDREQASSSLRARLGSQRRAT